MSQTLLIELTPAATPRRTLFTLQVNEPLTIEVLRAAPEVTLPQITRVKLFAGPGDPVIFSSSPGGPPPGIQWTFLVLRHTAAPTDLTECSLVVEGTQMVDGVPETWTTPEVTLILDPVVVDPSSGSASPADNPDQQFLLGLFLNNGNLTNIVNQQQFSVGSGNSLNFHVCGDPAFQTSDPSLVTVTVTSPLGAPLATFAWGENQTIPAGLSLPSIAFRNNGGAPSQTTYVVGLAGTVQLSVGGSTQTGSWMEEPELTLMTSASPGHV